MKAIYYFLGVIILIYEFTTLANVKERVKDMRLIISYKGKDYNTLDKDYKKLISNYFLFLVFNFVWLFIGLFTFQWLFYVYYIILMVIMGFIYSKIRKYDRLYYYFTIFDALTVITFVIFVVINSYHLHLTNF